MPEDYRYNKLPITPSIIEEIIVSQFNGILAKRDEIVSKVLDYHLSNGGLAPEAQDFTRSVKKALSRMSEKGIAINRSYGIWEINEGNAPRVVEDTEDNSSDVTTEEIPTYASFGNGINAVYLYYFENYKKLAELKGESSWPCKIGRTDRDPFIRVLSQVSTSLPEKPIIEYIIKVNDSALLESMIHSSLKLRKKQLKDAPGSEWFLTNPDEVLDIIKFVNSEILL